MKSVGQLLLGLITAVGSSLLVLSAVSLALLEGSIQHTVPTSTVHVQPSPTGSMLTQTVLPPVTATATQVQPTSCPTPEGWKPYVIQPGDTLESIAEQAGIPADQIQKANCLSGTSLIPNTILYLPVVKPTPTAPTALPTAQPTLSPTITSTLCGPPPGWVVYYVRSGDTLFRLSLELGISQSQLQSANCLSSTQIYVGQRLWVPFIPPTRVPVITSTATEAPVPSATPETPTVSPTTAVPSATAEPTLEPSPTDTPVPSATPVTPSPTTAVPTTPTTGAVEVGTVTPETTPGQ